MSLHYHISLWHIQDVMKFSKPPEYNGHIQHHQHMSYYHNHSCFSHPPTTSRHPCHSSRQCSLRDSPRKRHLSGSVDNPPCVH
ncbi:pathogenesis-related protein 1 precursor [Trifolium repens]|nr:pathogenesis-related protein 1 precursor [Trifolium repens]